MRKRQFFGHHSLERLLHSLDVYELPRTSKKNYVATQFSPIVASYLNRLWCRDGGRYGIFCLP